MAGMLETFPNGSATKSYHTNPARPQAAAFQMSPLARLLTSLLVTAALNPVRAAYGYSSDDRTSAYSPSSSPFERKCQSLGYGEGSYHDRGYWWENDLSQACKTQTSNAHGTYTSRGTCTFRFHQIANDTVKANSMSSACTDDNIVDEDQNGAMDDPVAQEVNNWPDACVGDFRRCYMIDRDERIVLPHLCMYKVTVPEGTTHISVDCTADKVRQIAQASPKYAVIAGAVAAVLVCLCSFIALCKRCFFQPYLNALKSSRTEYRYTDIGSDAELRGLSNRRFSSSDQVSKANEESSTCGSETEIA